MKRRTLVQTGLAALAVPAIAQPAPTIRFVPHAGLAVLDPVASSAYVTRNHGFLVWDTLYGIDAEYRAQPQMVAGHTVEDGGLRWTFTLREGLRFHDGEPVRASDCAASIRRWGARDAMGGRVLALAEEIAALD
ncbi:ABC transporter substrate-binding protein, partial [Elioraea sp.]|uniref:ABC transporter substrate-binding protein n=1 Tax=Elioraea sp. TaxID=2185103 RepID=UPI003F71F617